MGLVTILSRDPVLRGLSEPLGPPTSVAGTLSWDRLLHLVRERPVTMVVVDSASLPDVPRPDALLGELARRYPSVGTVFVARPGLSPLTLLQLGRAGIAGLTLLPMDDPGADLPRTLGRASSRTTASLVQRAIGARVPSRQARAIRVAIHAALLGWSADELAGHLALSRAHLSVLLREQGLPSVGQLLLWSRLLHAARWLDDPGRTAESVSRQLEYANGATFRRALRNYLGRTPTELVASGGFTWALHRFLDVCGLSDSLEDGLSVA